MSDHAEYKFKIEADYSPETIPMARLGEYMVELGHLLANPANVHFSRIEAGSVELVAKVDSVAMTKVRDRIAAFRHGEAANDAVESQNRLNAMLREDNARGYLHLVRDNKDEPQLVLVGKDLPKAEPLGPFTEPATIKAQLVRIGGREAAHVQFVDTAGRGWNGDLTAELAIEIDRKGGGGLYRWFQVTGTAKWIRTADNEWKLQGFRVQGAELLPEDTLEQDIARLREIGGSEWKSMDDPLEFIRERRRDDDEIH